MITFSLKTIKKAFGSFIVSNPLTGNPCVTYEKEHTIDDMMKEKKKLDEGRVHWGMLTLP